MTQPTGFLGPDSSQPQRRPFAANRQYKAPGVVMGVFSGMWLMNGLIGVILSGGFFFGHISIFVAAVALGLGSAYLLRGPKLPEGAVPTHRPVFGLRGMSRTMPRAMPAPMPTPQTAELVTQLATDLQRARGGAALVAYRRLDATIRHYYPHDAQLQLSRALSSIGFDMSTLNSPRLGYVAATEGPAVEVFRDWIIQGEIAHDVEPSTRGRVTETGSVQIHSEIVTDRNGQVSLVDKQVDTRAAKVSFTSDSWSLRAIVPRHAVDEAERLISDFNAQNESLAD